MMRILVVSVIWLMLASPALAGLKVIGTGNNRQFDTGSFPAKMKSSYELTKAKCTVCHSFERVLVAFTSGMLPLSAQIFDQDALKAISYRMFRKANAGNKNAISKEESKEISAFLNFLLNESVR